LLGYRQRIHIGPHRNDHPRLSPFEYPKDARMGDAGPHVDTQGLQMRGDALGGLELPVTQLRILMDMVPVLDDRVLVPSHRRLDLGVHNAGEWGLLSEKQQRDQS
jgi:hypothetical protein